MAQYDNIKNFCNRIIHLQKTGSKEIRLTQQEAIEIMCELNQLLLKEQNTVQVPTVESNDRQPVDAGTF
jgi:hypothetical protein|tara:strand:+ start:37 stop:243 length:207 start_codon:yes stop_codon:yes gene_type:complete